MANGLPSLLSFPLKCFWAGWETDTLRLQQNGWQLSAEQDVYYNRLRIAINHREMHIQGLSDFIDLNFHTFRLGDLAKYNPYQFANMLGPINFQLANRLLLNIQSHVPLNFSPIDAYPQMASFEPKSLEDLVYFAPNLMRTQELIIPEKSVIDLLDEIIKKQDPAKKAYFEQQVKEDRFNAAPRHKVHAQIISLVA